MHSQVCGADIQEEQARLLWSHGGKTSASASALRQALAKQYWSPVRNVIPSQGKEEAFCKRLFIKVWAGLKETSEVS